MTLGVQTVRAQYAGNSSTTTFAIPFNFYSVNANVLVYRLESDSFTVTPLVYSTDYTISSTNVVMNSAPVTGTQILIMSGLPLVQALAMPSQQPFLPHSLEIQIDQIVAYIQQLEERLNRCFSLERTSTITAFELKAVVVASSAIVTDATGTKLAIGPSTADISNAVTYAANAAASAASASSSATSASNSSSSASSSATAAAASAVAAAASAASAALAVGTVSAGEAVSGTVDGVNLSFTVAHTPNTSIPFMLYIDGLRETAFTRVGSAITMTTAPAVGQTLVADYNY